MDPKGKKNKPEKGIENVCLVRTGDWNFRLDDEGRLLWEGNICIKFLKKVRMGIIIWKKSNQDRENRNFKSPEARIFCVKTARRPQVWLSEEGEW